jgi:hypothetical protein
VRSRPVPFRWRLGPSLGPLPRRWPRILRQPSDSLAMPRSEDRWRPACRPLATARSRRVTFHLYKGTERPWTVAAAAGRYRGVLVDGETHRLLQALSRAITWTWVLVALRMRQLTNDPRGGPLAIATAETRPRSAHVSALAASDDRRTGGGGSESLDSHPEWRNQPSPVASDSR